jgi:S1-C subfamily serine protease
LVLGVLPGSRADAQGTATGFADRAVVQLLAIGPGEGGKNRECSATGFLVNAEGYLLTNAHVFEQSQKAWPGACPGAKILAKVPSRSSAIATAVSADLVALDDVHDLAVMKAGPLPGADSASEPWPFLPLEPTEVREATRVAVTGHPLFAWRSVTQSGQILRREKLNLSDRGAETSDVLVLNLSLRPGNSGSPVYLVAGDGVVGIVERRGPLSSETVVVPIHYATELLDRNGVAWRRSPM